MNVMQQAARKASRRLVRDFGEVEHLQVSKKGLENFVVSANERTKQILQDLLLHARPGFGYLTVNGEELVGEDDRRRWIFDPIDGKTNFMHGIPVFAISIALEESAEITAALVYAPIPDEMFWAEKGQGAYLNDQRLRVAARRKIGDALIGSGLPHSASQAHSNYLMEIQDIANQCAGVRRIGSSALNLSYVAAGRFDGIWDIGWYPWNLAAGLLLAKEAGALVSESDGGTDPLYKGDVLAANEAIHSRMLRLIQNARRA